MKISELIKLHIEKRLPALLAVALSSAVFFLYYIGVLDFSFIERPESWQDNRKSFVAMMETLSNKESEKVPEGEKEPDKAPDTDDKKDPTEDTTAPSRPNREPVEGGYQSFLDFPKVSDKKAEGYYLTDKPYDESCIFATLTPEYPWPDEFSYTKKTVTYEKVTKYEDGSETTVDISSKTVDRAAIELYMGYIIYDDHGVTYIISPDGAVMREYNDREYIPAYTRDLEGRPLFYKYVTTKEKYPITFKGEDEKGNPIWDKTGELNLKKKEYYYLDHTGQTFRKAEYTDSTDNRGLYFDYPSYYGTTDSKLSRYYLRNTKFFTPLKGETKVFDVLSFTYGDSKFKLDDFKFDKYGLLLPKEDTKDTKDDKELTKEELEEKIKEWQEDEEKNTKAELFPYTMAYNYSEKYATVFMDIDWSYDHDVKGEDGKTEKKTFDVTTNELRVINEKGEVMFESRKNFFSDLSWTAHEKYTKPLLSGIESLGSYYFDHGLMRVRLQSWDCYYFAEFDTVKVVTDEDILIDPRGQRFNIPTGYDLISYSDGNLLLEKDGLYGYMNYLSSWTRDPELLDAKPFLEGLAVCKNTEGNYGVIDTEGNAVIPFVYEYISNVSGGTIAAYSPYYGWTIYQKMTK